MKSGTASNMKRFLQAILFFTPITMSAMLFTNNATIGYDDTRYDGQEIIVNKCNLTVNGRHNFSLLLLTNSATLTHTPASNGETNNRMHIVVQNWIAISTNSRVDVTGCGYAPGNGPGAGVSGDNGGGGSHGGVGGRGQHGPASGTAYDLYDNPSTPGSGGGNYRGGSGGGVVILMASGVLRVDGSISANGMSASD